MFARMHKLAPLKQMDITKFYYTEVLNEYERVTQIVQLQKTVRLPHEWPLPHKIHCISSDCNNRRQQT